MELLILKNPIHVRNEKRFSVSCAANVPAVQSSFAMVLTPATLPDADGAQGTLSKDRGELAKSRLSVKFPEKDDLRYDSTGLFVMNSLFAAELNADTALSDRYTNQHTRRQRLQAVVAGQPGRIKSLDMRLLRDEVLPKQSASKSLALFGVEDRKPGISRTRARGHNNLLCSLVDAHDHHVPIVGIRNDGIQGLQHRRFAKVVVLFHILCEGRLLEAVAVDFDRRLDFV
jgi:hypothetical protein